MNRTPLRWRLRTRVLDDADGTPIMGILNVTPDSFSDGGDHLDLEDAVAAAHRMVADGASLIDVGGESTRPGAVPVEEAEERRRVVPVVRALAAEGIIVSVDTSKASVAAEAIDAGAEVVNDVTGLRDPALRAVCAETEVGVVAMHMQGRPRTMQDAPRYGDVVVEVADYLERSVAAAVDAGIDEASIVVDPGIGFGKTLQHNLELMANAAEVGRGRPVLIGHSRKRFLGTLTGLSDPKARDAATAVASALAVLAGVSVVRVHDVAATSLALSVADAMVAQGDREG